MPESPSSIVSLSAVNKTYRRGGEELRVLVNLDLEIPEGDFAALMGPSGSGKSTILNIAGGLDRADSGTVIVAGEDITRQSNRQLARWRARHIGFVFQSFNLVPVLSALENVSLPLLNTPLDRTARKKQAEFALDIVGLSDRRGHRPSQLSGGQEQRVAIARALATDPDLILADEPTGDLDRETANEVMNLLQRLNQELGKTILMVTHDQVAAEQSKRILSMDKGELQGTTGGHR